MDTLHVSKVYGSKLLSSKALAFVPSTYNHAQRTFLSCCNFQRHLVSSKVHPSSSSSSTRKVWCCAPAQPLVSPSSAGNTLGVGDSKIHDEHTLLLKIKANELVSDLRGTCIYLVGMMGSGKTTVGKLLAEALGYHFIDSDKVIEEVAGGVSVAQLFKQQDEESFRDAETEVLKQLSCNGRLVIATGGGIVIRPVNWSYLRYGVTVWLDVPLEALAERVAAAGIHSRPLLGVQPNGDSAHSQALARLTSIFEKRGSCYANSDARVCIQKLASNLGYHVRDITPTIIAVQVLEEINSLMISKKRKGNASGIRLPSTNGENFVES